MFRITEGQGFQVTFSNGVTVSVQFSPGHYCYNRGLEGYKAPGSSPDAEVAIWRHGQEGYITKRLFGGADTEGWCSPERVLEALNWAANLPRAEEKGLLYHF